MPPLSRTAFQTKKDNSVVFFCTSDTQEGVAYRASLAEKLPHVEKRSPNLFCFFVSVAQTANMLICSFLLSFFFFPFLSSSLFNKPASVSGRNNMKSMPESNLTKDCKVCLRVFQQTVASFLNAKVDIWKAPNMLLGPMFSFLRVQQQFCHVHYENKFHARGSLPHITNNLGFFHIFDC